MVKQRFIYDNGMDIISPLKCGTRWLTQNTTPKEVITYAFHQAIGAFRPELPLTKDTIWVYRPPDEHLISALHTEIPFNVNYDKYTLSESIDKVVTSFLNGSGTHWSPYLFKHIYELRREYWFQICKLSELSTLFPSDLEYDPIDYLDNSKWDKEDIIEVIGKESMYKLMRCTNEEFEWMKRVEDMDVSKKYLKWI
jgi:hypothetical protein